MIETEVSIDRLTVMGRDTGSLPDYLKENGENSSYIARQNFSQNYGFRHAYHLQNGELLEVGLKGKIRLDFNPNTANMKQIEHILSCMKYPYLTRLDIAVDYFGKDLSNVEWTSSKRRKRNVWMDEDLKVETLYIGAPTSDKRYRIYNKLLERLEKGEERDIRAKEHHWRVEVQKRYKENDNLLYPEEYFLNDLFDISPCVKDLDLSHIEDVKERMIVRGLLAEPSAIKEFNKNTRPKYKKLIQGARERAGRVLEEEPHEVYEKEKARLIGELADLFKNCATPLALS